MGKLGLGCLAILVILVVIVGISFAGTYNRLVTGQDVDSSWSEVENQYQRRADLDPEPRLDRPGCGELREGNADGRDRSAGLGRAHDDHAGQGAD